jgi:monoamine oxidase
VEVIFGAEPEAISLLHFLFYVRAGGGFLRLAEIERGAQQDRFVGGAQGLSLGLAARLGERVRLDTPVRAIRHVGGGVRVSTDRGELAARRVIVAVPPALVDGIELDPPLPPARRALAGSIPMGATTKVLVCYDRAFWRDRGLSGEVVTRQGPIAVTFDNTSHDGAQPALVAFIVGERAHEHARRDEATRRAVVLDALARWFGPEARTPRALVEKEWAAEPWSGGCPVGVAAPGRYLGLSGALRAAHGAVHFAGTETARVWNGYLEGAIEAGERAADEVLAALAAKGRQA